MATRLIAVFFTENGLGKTGLSATITIYRLSDNNVVVNSDAMTEVGGGWYKYSFTSYDPDEDYASSCNADTDSVDARVVYSVSSTADIRSIREQTDNLPADPASETNVDANESKIDIMDGNLDAIVGKLPTNFIMGSTVQSSMNDEIDDIKAKTDNLPADPASESNATSNTSNIITEIDANETKIDALPSTSDIDTELSGSHGSGNWESADVSSLALEATAQSIKAKTDNLPADPASETNVDANETKIDTLQSSVTTVDGKADSIQADLDNPNQYKADVSGLATESNATTNTNNIIAEIDANESKIDDIDTAVDTVVSKLPSGDIADQALIDSTLSTVEGKIDNLQTDITSMESKVDTGLDRMARLLGLVHENTHVTNVFTSGKHTSSIVEIYDSKTNAENHDGTGLLASYTLSIQYTGDSPTEYTMVKE